MDTDTFLTTLYVTIDDFDQAQAPPDPLRPGPGASLSRSEVVTLALFGQWACFASERGFYRYARRHLQAAFPRLPARAQFNRLLRQHRDAIAAFALHLAQEVLRPDAAYEARDECGGADPGCQTTRERMAGRASGYWVE